MKDGRLQLIGLKHFLIKDLKISKRREHYFEQAV